jgi:hypothetical protein
MLKIDGSSRGIQHDDLTFLLIETLGFDLPPLADTGLRGSSPLYEL